MIGYSESNIKYEKFSRNIFFMLFAYGLVFFSNFVLGLYSSWIGGPSLFGIINLTRKWAIIFGTILEFGIVSTLPKFVAEKRTGNYLKVSVIILILESSISFILGLILLIFLPISSILVVELGLISSSSIILHGLFYSIARGNEDIRKMYYLQFSLSTVRLISFILLNILKFDLFINIILSFSLFPIIFIVLIVPFMKFRLIGSLIGDETEKNKMIFNYNLRNKIEIVPKIRKGENLHFKNYIKFSAPVYLSSVVAIIAVQLDSLLIGFLFSSYEIGLYLVAVSICGLLNIINNAINVILLPTISKNAQKKSVVIKYMQQSINFLLLCFIPVLLILFFYPDLIVRLIYGPGYNIITYFSLRILIISTLFNLINAIIIETLIGLDRPKYKFFGYLSLFISKFGFFFLTVPFFGIYGISLAVLISEIVQFTYLIISFKRVIKEKYYKSTKKKIITRNYIRIKYWIFISFILLLNFIPGLYISLDFVKIILICAGLLITLIIYLLNKDISFILPTNSKYNHKTNINKRNKIISERINKISNFLIEYSDLLLDNGCGNGAILNKISRSKFKVGIEPDIAKLREYHSQKNYFGQIYLINAVGENLPFRENKFDFIISQMVLEHCKNPVNYLHECFRVLKKSKYIYIAVPNSLYPIEPHIKIPFIGYFPSGTIQLLKNKVRNQFIYPKILKILRIEQVSIFDLNLYVLKHNLVNINRIIGQLIHKHFSIIKRFYNILKFILPSWAFLLEKN